MSTRVVGRDGMVGLLGAGAQARENASYLPAGTPTFHAVTREYLREGLVDLASPSVAQRDCPVIASVGPPGLRRQFVEAWPGRTFMTLIADGAHVAAGVEPGPGSVVAPGAVITVGVRLGAHTIVNIGATLSHDVTVGEYVTVSPGAHIAGRVRLNDGVWVGIGATIADGVSLAPGVVVGAGATVIADIMEDNAVVIGNPARLLRLNPTWLTAL